jgi:cysteinyl-tRNA synthetase
MELSFFNTLARRGEVFRPLEPGRVKMYTCGPTVYNYAHIGNFRAYSFEDILRRTLKYFDFEVTQVMNLTDVDDKTIRDSRKAGLPLDEFTAKYKRAFFDDLKVLNIEPAEYYPAATDHIGEMIELIRILLDKGYAYQAEDKSVYFSIAKFPDYGKLARIDRENQRAGVRISNDEYAKDAVADFALWKARDENDGDVCWESPWGQGRPGWHIECSAMSMKYLGDAFDIHTGGIDNMFPHHEDEIAQSEAVTGKKWVTCWLHCAHLMVDGEKMSKSLGNFYTLRDLLAKGWTGREIRLVLIGTHYRKKLNFTLDALDQARDFLRRIDELAVRLDAAPVQAAAADGELDAALDAIRHEFEAGLADDLNISVAQAAVFELVKAANRRLDEGRLDADGAARVKALFDRFDRVFGCFDLAGAAGRANADTTPADVAELAAARQAARKSKNFAESDRLRDELKLRGYAVEDAPGGEYRVKKL